MVYIMMIAAVGIAIHFMVNGAHPLRVGTFFLFFLSYFNKYILILFDFILIVEEKN